jgi:hypothetical protein
VLDCNDVPERTGQAQQGKVDRGHSHHEESRHDHARKIRAYKWKKSSKGRHACGGIDVRAWRWTYGLSPSQQMLAVDGLPNEDS